MKTNFIFKAIGLLVVVAAFTFSGCAMNDGYTPISSGPSFGSAQPSLGGFRSSGGG